MGKRSTTAKPTPPRHPGPTVGLLEWFRPGDHDRVDRVLADLAALNVTHLRTGISWADWQTPDGEAWYAWLFPQLSRQVDVLPCFVNTPPSWGVAPKHSAPPHDPRSYADFVDTMIRKFGRHFTHVELWNEPNNGRCWDAALDPDWFTFAEMVGAAANWAKQCGKTTVLGGMSPVDPAWLRLMGERNLLQYIDVVGIHAFPAPDAGAWRPMVDRVREVLAQYRPDAQVWITEAGYSTWRLDERRQLTAFVDALDAPVDRLYWYSATDLDPSLPTVEGFHADERDYHYGLRRSDGGAKLLHRLWSDGGLDAVRDAYWLGKSAAHVAGRDKPALITGGCGFIGTNLADRLMSSGQPVLLFDNLSRVGVERNLAYLKRTHGDKLRVEAADVRDTHALRRAVDQASQVFHFAAQVAVTTSLTGAIHDFEVNARGTLNLLEAIRAQDVPPPLVFTSTNKVYGGLTDVAMRQAGRRYEPVDEHVRTHGIGEFRPLDFHSPYGCSKGAADQYVVDYARTFGLPAVAFRMSCIYGPHQCGNEDQGWVAHFLMRAMRGEPITLYGDGMQVRDVLFADDLVDAFLIAQAKMPAITGHAFNVGGGPGNTISLLDLLEQIAELTAAKPDVRFGAWRPGDQRYYVSDTAKLAAMTGWTPKVSARAGVAKLHAWLRDNAAATKDRSPARARPSAVAPI